MLDAYVIDAIRRELERERALEEARRVEIPRPVPELVYERPVEDEAEEEPTGPIVIPMNRYEENAA